MDHPNLNMKQRRWLDVVIDYDCEILYNLRKVNVVAEARSHKEVSALIRDLCLRMIIILPLLDMIKKAQL